MSSSRPSARVRFVNQMLLLRRKRGWSQEELADQSGLHRTYIGALERLERNPGLDNLEKIAAALGVSLEQMFSNVPEEDVGQNASHE